VVTVWSRTPWFHGWRQHGTMGTMKSARSRKEEIEQLRRAGDPRASEEAKKLIREITRGPDLALELQAQAKHDPELAG
jgi:hypothetical protein